MKFYMGHHKSYCGVDLHALSMKAIHGRKTKNDRIDANKIAVLLRGGLLPVAYVCPPRMRSTRDLLRRRISSPESAPR